MLLAQPCPLNSPVSSLLCPLPLLPGDLVQSSFQPRVIIPAHPDSTLIFCLYVFSLLGFHGGSVVKKPPANAGAEGSIPMVGRSPEEGNVNPLQYFAWEIVGTEKTTVGSQESDTT